MKTCSKCGMEKPDDSFGKRGDKDALRSACRACESARYKESYLLRKTEHNSRTKKWAESESGRKWFSGYQRDYYLKKTYGISAEEASQMLARQEGRCAICRTDTPGGKGWHTDHDHVTNTVRALLCGQCNLGLGGFRDNPDNLRLAALYIERHKGFDDSTLIGVGC